MSPFIMQAGPNLHAFCLVFGLGCLISTAVALAYDGRKVGQASVLIAVTLLFFLGALVFPTHHEVTEAKLKQRVH